ncbi:MAG: hypothetical protein ACP5KB_00865 [Thermoprotei archaeon]
MGRRSRKKYKVFRPPQRTLPKVFQCPACGSTTIIIDVETYTNDLGEEKKRAFIKCMNPRCGLRAELTELPSIFEAVDAYSKFLELYSSDKIKTWFEKGEVIE